MGGSHPGLLLRAPELLRPPPQNYKPGNHLFKPRFGHEASKSGLEQGSPCICNNNRGLIHLMEIYAHHI